MIGMGFEGVNPRSTTPIAAPEGEGPVVPRADVPPTSKPSRGVIGKSPEGRLLISVEPGYFDPAAEETLGEQAEKGEETSRSETDNKQG